MRYTLGVLGDLASIMATISSAAAQYGLDPGFVAAVAQAESGLNPNAVSAAGAKGIMQLMDATAAMLGVSNPFDPVQNINAGVRYLAQLLNQFAGDAAKALAAYNWGPGNVNKAVQQWGADWLAHAPQETINYVQKLTGVTPNLQPSNVEPSNAPLTIDAATGQPIDDSTPTPAPSLPSWMPQTPIGRILLLTGAVVGASILADTLLGD
jgi:soluble lytic murein transglycosylase-like protein